MVSHTSFSDSKSPQLSRTLLSILVDLNNAVVWMFSTRPHSSKSSSLCTNSLLKLPRATIPIGHFHVPQFFQSSSNVQVLIPLLAFFKFSSVVDRDNKVHNSASSLFFFLFFFLLTVTRSGRLAEIRGSVCSPKSPTMLWISFSRTDYGFYIYHLFVWSNANFFNSF